MKMVSVVIPTYNRASVIADTIQSILNQSYSELEIIAVSDGRDSSTQEVVEGFKDNRVRYYEIEHSGRPAVPRNFGIEKSCGEFIAFCDDDDIWMPQKLELQMKKIAEDDKIGLVYARCLVPNKKGDIVIPYNGAGKEGFIFKELFLSYNFIPNSTVLIKREIVHKVGKFDEDTRLKATEDFDLWLRIAQQYKVSFVDEILAVHRDSRDSISRGTFRRLGKECLVSWRCYYKKKYVGLKLFIEKLLLMGKRGIFGLVNKINLLKSIKRKGAI